MKPAWLLSLILPVASDVCAEVTVEELIAENSYTLEFDGAKLSGAGWNFLLDASATAQFVGIAESHNVREIPQFVTALLRQLNEQRDFNYLALEQGPYVVELLGDAARAQDPDRFFGIAHRYPEALHFHTDQELAMLNDVAAIPGAPILRVWGLDRAVATRHILDRLASVAPNDEARRIAEETLDAANEMLSKDDAGYDDDRLLHSETDLFERLESAFGPAPGSEEAHLIETLQHAYRSHRTYIEATEENGLGYQHNLEREDWMKTQFLRQYRAAQASGDRFPKVVLKFGHWHMLRGQSRGRVSTLGNFLTELARSNDREALILNLAPINPPDRYWSLTDYPDYREVAAAGAVDRWVLVDLRPLRGHVHSGAIELSGELERAVFNSDAFLLMGGASRGTQEWLTPGTRQ